MSAHADFPTWPPDLAASYRERGFWEDLSIGDAILAATDRFRDRLAIVDGATRITYGELRSRIDRFSGHLVERGICAGERVVFQLPNVLDFVVAYVAAMRVGAIPICCLPEHRFAEVSALASLAEAKAWFLPDTWRGFDYGAMIADVRRGVPSIREVWVRGEPRAQATATFDELHRTPSKTTPEAIANARPSPMSAVILQLSGGTTGVPKLIPRTHNDYLYATRKAIAFQSIDSESVVLIATPIAHNFALVAIQSALLVGAHSVLTTSASAEVVLPIIERERITHISAVPAILIKWTHALEEHPRDVSCVRAIYVGGQRLNPEPAAAAMRVFGPVLRQIYGMAEGVLTATTDADPPEMHRTTQGRPQSAGDELRAVDEHGKPVPPGEIGELEWRGPTVIRGYYRAPEATKKAIREDGFFRTGDLGRILPNGYVVLEGRTKDVINRGGEKIAVEEVENLILGHPSVANVAVVGVPDAVLGERACACIVLREGTKLTHDELVSFLKGKQIAQYKLPERLELFDSLPLTKVGKVAKKELRDLLAAGR